MTSLLEDMNKVIEDFPDNTEFLWAEGFGKVVEDEVLDTTRWAILKRTVFDRDGEFVAVRYSVGATEYQEDTPPEAEAYPVAPVAVTVTKYVRVIA